MERATVELQVSPQEGHLLSYLRSYAPCPVSELVRVFGLKHSTMTSILDRLEERGLVARSLNPHDRRSLLVKLTRQGKSLSNRVQGIVEAFEDQLHQAVTKKDIKGFHAVMAAIDRVTNVTLRDRRGT
jgi:DNA-binding MarR family transcriptional regulator